MLLVQCSAVQITLFDAQWMALLLIAATTFSITAQCCRKKQKKKGAPKTEASLPTPEVPPPPGEEKKPVPAEEAEKKKKARELLKKARETENSEGTCDCNGPNNHSSRWPNEDHVHSTNDATTTKCTSRHDSCASSPYATGRSPTVFMMPSKGMQSVAALTAQPAKQTAPAQPTPSKTERKGFEKKNLKIFFLLQKRSHHCMRPLRSWREISAKKKAAKIIRKVKSLRETRQSGEWRVCFWYFTKTKIIFIFYRSRVLSNTGGYRCE